jgi:murein DD-endopeptidase MepM/ murein hydrolase activator NlpD
MAYMSRPLLSGEEKNVGPRVMRPVDGFPITQLWGQLEGKDWGVRNPDGTGGHPGTDYGCPSGTPLLAVADGIVSFAGPAEGFGDHCVAIWHPDHQVTSLYGHGQAHFVNAGDEVAAGQQVADSGNQGWSSGPHLHFEIRTVNSPFGGNPPNIDSEAWLLSHLNTALTFQRLAERDPLMAMPTIDANQQLDMDHPDVRTLQGVLGARGAWIKPDNTDRRVLVVAINWFQEQAKLPVNAIADAATWKAAAHPPGSNAA